MISDQRLAPALDDPDPDDGCVPLPAVGRAFTGRRKVRLGDVSPNGRLRFDALARFAQDVSNDDTVDAGLEDDMAWVVRRTVVEVHTEARFREELELTTFCGGIGSRWAERRVQVRGAEGAEIELATLWVHLDMDTGRPLKLPPQFHELYAEAAGGRKVRAKLRHGDPPADGIEPEAWPLRFSDFDVLDHVNNAVSWAAVEEARAPRRHLRAPVRAEIEYRAPIERGHEVVRLAQDHEGGGLSLWLVDAADHRTVYTSARVLPLPA
ncbi:acyl-[acyl-carrier-protein] thioesterase [Actinomarinicola tropica]|nr:acyl-ACP thioesterase domain-containing protein [Actinomarinicola tropica]